MALSPAHARLFLGFIALALAGVEFSPLVLGRALYEITFLGIHFGATTAIAFLIIGLRSRRKSDEAVPLIDVALAVLALACAVYFAFQGYRVSERIEGVDEVYVLDQVFGTLLVLLLLEASRRVAGFVLMLLAALFIAYVFLGPYLPGALVHRG